MPIVRRLNGAADMLQVFTGKIVKDFVLQMFFCEQWLAISDVSLAVR
jgi:hypothetical protein